MGRVPSLCGSSSPMRTVLLITPLIVLEVRHCLLHSNRVQPSVISYPLSSPITSLQPKSRITITPLLHGVDVYQVSQYLCSALKSSFRKRSGFHHFRL